MRVLDPTIPLLIGALLMVPVDAFSRTFKIATLSPDGTSWMQEMRRGGEEIEEQTKGRVRFKFYPGGVMGNDQTVLRKIRVGQLQGGAFAAGGLVEIYNDMQLYSLPFLFRDHDEVDYVRERMDPLLRKGLDDRGLVAVGLSEGGFAYLLSSHPLRRRDDLEGRKVWIPQGDTMSRIALETANISPVPLSIADVYTGLQTGLIDTIASSPVGVIAFQWHTKVRFLTDVPLMYLFGTLAFAKKPFEELSEEDRSIVRAVMGEIFERLDRENRSDNAAAKTALVNQGIELVSPTSEERDRWRSIAAEATLRYESSGLYSDEMHEILQGHLRDFRRGTADEIGP